jgi:DNA-3-methyladenine glycosylase
VCDEPGRAEAVLVRALAPERGLEEMRARRGVLAERALCSGPGKLCQALAITGAQDGVALDAPPFELVERTGTPAIVTGPRIGITRAVEQSWRYGLKGSPFLSRPF